MPYITGSSQKQVDQYGPSTVGELNYALTKVVLGYLERQRYEDGRESYRHYNDVLGALEGCKLEMYRRKIAGYEDFAREKNGDIF